MGAVYGKQLLRTMVHGITDKVIGYEYEMSSTVVYILG